jgi:hypothetical protein
LSRQDDFGSRRTFRQYPYQARLVPGRAAEGLKGRVLDQVPGSEFSAAAPEDNAFAVVPLHGRFVYLRPIGPEDYGFLRVAELGGDLGVRWGFEDRRSARISGREACGSRRSLNIWLSGSLILRRWVWWSCIGRTFRTGMRI